MKNIELSFYRPRFVPHSFTIGENNVYEMKLSAESKFRYVRSPRGISKVSFRVLGFGFEYFNRKNY